MRDQVDFHDGHDRKGKTVPSAGPRSIRPGDHEIVTGAKPSDIQQLEDLVSMDSPQSVFAETRRIAGLMHPNLDLRPLQAAFENTLRLFRGEYPGYLACNILYHDLKHTTDCLMAMARLLHGASLHGFTVGPGNLILALIAALHHDTGYIQKNDEISGTGARFTLSHIDRSMTFLQEYAAGHPELGMDLSAAADILKCTGLDVQISEIAFACAEHELIGKCLGTADLLGQMADRTYIERLPALYREFVEGNVPGFADEADLMRKTPGFWEYTKKRFAADLGGVDRYMIDHFRARWEIDCDLYRRAIEANITYLKYLMKHHAGDYRKHLRRGGIIERLARLEAAEAAEAL
ncbi:MAG: hypothetical protein WAW37_04400 [Syntrophobacteraceae bacterium]